MKIKEAVNADCRRHPILSSLRPIGRIMVILAILATVMMGCSGTMNGVIRRDAMRIDIIYSDSRVNNADLLVVMPNGERFEGKTEVLNKAKDMLEADPEDVSAHFEVMQTFNGNVKANLTGSRGSEMRCRFKVADFLIGFNSGGFGLCQMDDGRVIDVFF